jgi:hypothetical protein
MGKSHRPFETRGNAAHVLGQPSDSVEAAYDE